MIRTTISIKTIPEMFMYVDSVVEVVVVPGYGALNLIWGVEGRRIIFAGKCSLEGRYRMGIDLGIYL